MMTLQFKSLVLKGKQWRRNFQSFRCREMVTFLCQERFSPSSRNRIALVWLETISVRLVSSSPISFNYKPYLCISSPLRSTSFPCSVPHSPCTMSYPPVPAPIPLGGLYLIPRAQYLIPPRSQFPSPSFLLPFPMLGASSPVLRALSPPFLLPFPREVWMMDWELRCRIQITTWDQINNTYITVALTFND